MRNIPCRHPRGTPLRLIVLGASGRMGSLAMGMAKKDSRFERPAGIVRRASAGNFPPSEFSGLLRRSDAVLDFSEPASSLLYLKTAVEFKKPVVIGVTGFSETQLLEIRSSSKKLPVFLASNFSRGIFLMGRLIREAARGLSSYDAAVSEVHHKMKKDSPSGTARFLAEILRKEKKSGVPISASRVGDVVGEHRVVFTGPFERLEIAHEARGRELFAEGALEAVLWLRRQKPGLYGMEDLWGRP